MNLRIAIPAALLATGLLPAQQSQPPVPAPAAGAPQSAESASPRPGLSTGPDLAGYEASVIPVKSLSGDSFIALNNLLNTVFKDYRISGNQRLSVILVYAPQTVVEQVRRVVEQLDDPKSSVSLARNVDATLTLLRCSTAARAAATPLPGDLETTAKQIRAMTQYRSVELWDTVPLRLTERNRTEATVVLPRGAGQQPIRGSLSVTMEAVRQKPAGRYITLSQVSGTFQESGGDKNPSQSITTASQVSAMFQESSPDKIPAQSIVTAGDFLEGQKTVIGKMPGADDGEAIFIVVQLKVLD